ncbi:MAG: hypothetical protein GF388_03195 [Candidatus Aegiribacteria sp.]|nr:hypothetical protein [Candidatus Aegiribacteria sp.]MBD3294274.1 hypothetical protein [Candidatus Fermentibacteria bacterium]
MSSVSENDGLEASSPELPQPMLNMRIVQSLVWFIDDRFGESKLEALSFECGIPLETLSTCRDWISLQQVETLLKFVRDHVDSDEEFKQACVYRMRESYGPLRFLLWATTPAQMLEMGQKHFSSISTFSHGDFQRISDSRFKLRYHSDEEESRLMCLSRQAQSNELPRLWGLPPGRLVETSCISHGDDFCEYELSVYEKSRFLPVAIGGLLGGVVSMAAFHLSGWTYPSMLYLFFCGPLTGAAMGYIFELRRSNSQNLRIAEDINKGLAKLVVESEDTRREILAFHRREREWSQMLEDQVTNRTKASEDLSRKLHSVLEEKTMLLKGVSHDMKNPLTVILQAAEIMEEKVPEQNLWMVDEQKKAVDKIRVLLDEMLQIQSQDVSAISLSPERVEIKPLEDSLRRRLRALAGDKGLRISVIATREAPEEILVNRMLMNRVIDNLLTNAVKYTDKGSIVVELDGKPGFLTIKVSDTGRGIDRKDLDKVFSPGGSDPEKRIKGSHGLGLSVVVRLLDSIGGKLEVMSLPKKGTTFWVHFPNEPEEEAVKRDTSEEDGSDPADRVVTIRKVI